jgi:hypothetical protein
MPAVPEDVKVLGVNTQGQESLETTTTAGAVATVAIESKEMAPPGDTNYPILWWTPPLPFTLASPSQEGEEAWHSLPFTLDTCGLEYTCTFTSDRSLLSTTNAVLFMSSQLDAQDIPVASERASSQAWILNTGKSNQLKVCLVEG